MNTTELKERFEQKADLDSDINLFIFDDLASINVNRNKSYPLILMKTPQSVITPFMERANEGLYENYTVTFYIFDTWKKADKDTKPLEVTYTNLEAIATGYLQEVLQSGGADFSLFGDRTVTKQRGHHQHVDQLVAVEYSFTLRVFNSLCNS